MSRWLNSNAAVVFRRRSKLTGPLHPASRQAPIQRVFSFFFFHQRPQKSLLFLCLLVDRCNFYDSLARMEVATATTATASAFYRQQKHKERSKQPNKYPKKNPGRLLLERLGRIHKDLLLSPPPPRQESIENRRNSWTIPQDKFERIHVESRQDPAKREM